MSDFNRSAGTCRSTARALIAACMMVVLLAPPVARAAEPDNAALPQNETLAKAAAVIDNWGGRSDELQAARPLLDAVLANDPRSVQAHYLYARFYIDAAMINSRNYDPAILQRAEKALDRAVDLSPSFADAFVLRGSLYQLQKRPVDALAALQHARSLGSQSPWLDIFEADLMLDEGRHVEVLARCRNVAKQSAGNPRVLAAAEECMRDAHWGLQQFDEVGALHRATVERNPRDAWARGNYASFLLCTQHKAQAAIEYATSALQLMDYGLARLTLAAAFYHEWADHVRAGRTAQADQAWLRAVHFAPGDPAKIAEDVCGRNAMFAVLYALRDSHRADIVAPMAAVLLAADGKDDGVPGVFGFKVAATGRSRGEVFLNSESDYRDQRNLTIRFTPEAAAAYRKQHGVDPDAALKDKYITVVGAARRQRIDFLNAGLPTGKFYYQTHVVVRHPEQIAIFDPDVPPSPPPPAPAATHA